MGAIWSSGVPWHISRGATHKNNIFIINIIPLFMLYPWFTEGWNKRKALKKAVAKKKVKNGSFKL